MTDDIELRSVSVKLDGRESIEHQLDIHVLDLVESSHNPDIELGDVLAGIQYVVEYRILGGKMPNLSLEIMARLAQGLLAIMPRRMGGLLSKKYTPEANLSFVLFGQFLEEVEEFRQTVNEKSASDLQHSFALHKRLDQEEITASFLSVVLKYCFQISDWRELVKEDDQDKIQNLIEKYQDKFKDPGMISATQMSFPPQVLYFDKNPEKLANMFGSDTVNGLPQDLVTKHREYYGMNKIPEPPKPSIIKMILTQFTDFMIVILLIVALVDFFTDEIPAGVALVLVVLLNAIIGFTQELKAKKALDALMSLHVPVAKVIRDGQTSVVDAAELVPGDLVSLDEGDIVPADLRLCEVVQLEVIEVILTGESLGIPKSTRTIRKRTRKLPLCECKGNLFMATVVARGRGKGIVVRVGDSSEIGRISQAISATPHEKTILEQRLDSLGKYLVGLAVVMCLIIIFISLGYRRDTRETILLGVSLAVSVIPESLVAVVTVAMALGVKRMAEQNAIVRKLPAVESLGSVGVICSDKTGTLTEGKMGASALWTSDGTSYVFTESTNINPEAGNINQKNGSHLIPLKKQPAQSGPTLMAAMMSASLCNNSSIVKDLDTSEWKAIGDPTEIAMLVAGRKVGISREWLQDDIGLEKIGEYAFDSDRKMMSVIYEQGTRINNDKTFTPGSTFILAKGAPERILKNCTGYLPHSTSESYKDLPNLSSSPLSDEIVENISNESSSMAHLGLRVLAFAIRVVTSSEASEIIKSNKSVNSETNLTFVGLIGLIDPPKNGVKKSVETCHAAGIKVIMITGDHISTAVSIAKQLSIIKETDTESAVSMKGYEVDLLSEDNLAATKPFPRVFARVSPDNKLKIIKALQKRGESVSMTGDGVNDAPAIKKANVGVAMGISGTEITKQAADIVLADDNFTTIVVAVKEGRLVFDNIRKFCSYILTCSASEVILFLAAAIRNSGDPFGKLPILYANIIADVPPALSLGLEPAESDIMERHPRPVNEHVLTIKISILVLINGLVISMISFAVLLLSKEISIFGDDSFIKNHTKQESLTFAVLVMGHLVQSFLSKSLFNSIFTTGVTNNIWMIIAFISSSVLLAIGIEAPVIQGWLEFTGIGGTGWAVVFISAAVQVCIIELIENMGITDKIADIEKEIARTQKNKATEYHLGLLKAKLAKYRAMLLEPTGKSGPKGVGFDVVRSGDARVALIGFPSVGKSTLLNKITETKSEIGAYEFTTLTCVPGKISYNGAQIQLLDLPGIIEGAAQGIGRGRQVIAVAKTSDLILMMLDATKGPKQRELLEAELEAVGIRINTKKPNIYFKIKKGGGISFNGTCKLTHLNERIVYSILHDYKIHNAEVLVREDATVDEFIDVILGTRKYVKCIYCYNKVDQVTIEEIDELARRENTVVVSCEMDLNMDSLVATIWYHLDLIRIYTKKRGEFPDFDGGLILKRGCSVEDVCRNIHRSLLDEFKFALVWGSSAKHNAQRVGMSHICEDEDVIQIVKKKS